MEHRPYEDWLLNDERLTPEQQRDLRRHTANCPKCAALARATLSLRAAPLATPANGFALRFQSRLQAERKIQQKRATTGLVLLSFIGTGVLIWLIRPLFPYLSLSPAQLFVTWVSALIYISSALQALGTLGSVFGRVVLELVPVSALGGIFLLAGALSALWVLSLRKISNKQKAYSPARL